MDIELQLGMQFYMVLKYHIKEALMENNSDPNIATCQPYFCNIFKKILSYIHSISVYSTFFI
jgi:hypothetical protein